MHGHLLTQMYIITDFVLKHSCMQTLQGGFSEQNKVIYRYEDSPRGKDIYSSKMIPAVTMNSLHHEFALFIQKQTNSTLI